MTEWISAGERPIVEDPTSASPTFEIWPIVDREDVTGTPWALYQDRFRRSATRHGFTSALGAALSAALMEMSDNIFQHSGGARGFAAYHFTIDRATWCVADIGQGILASLKTNPRWQHLATAREALAAVWSEHATSRTNESRGHGFSEVERSIAAIHGHLRFRTDDAVLELDGRRDGRLRPVSSSSPAMRGFQASATCSLVAAEIPPLNG